MKTFETLIGAETRAAIKQNTQIKQVISQIVPASSARHIEFCRVEGGRLRVTVDNAVWVAKLRFGERQIIRALQSAKLDVHTVSWHVSPAEKPVTRTTQRRANPLSAKSAKSLSALVGETTDDAPAQNGVVKSDSGGKLREELLKLAAKLRE